MIQFNASTQMYQLLLDDTILHRLRLLDKQGRPLIIVHADPILLQDLEQEIMDRYRVRELAWQRDRTEERWLDWASMPLLLIVLFGPVFSPQLSAWSGISETVLTVSFLVLLGAGYGAFYRLTGRHERTSASTALLQDLQLLHWIRQHCHT